MLPKTANDGMSDKNHCNCTVCCNFLCVHASHIHTNKWVTVPDKPYYLQYNATFHTHTHHECWQNAVYFYHRHIQSDKRFDFNCPTVQFQMQFAFVLVFAQFVKYMYTQRTTHNFFNLFFRWTAVENSNSHSIDFHHFIGIYVHSIYLFLHTNTYAHTHTDGFMETFQSIRK